MASIPRPGRFGSLKWRAGLSDFPLLTTVSIAAESIVGDLASYLPFLAYEGLSRRQRELVRGRANVAIGGAELGSPPYIVSQMIVGTEVIFL